MNAISFLDNLFINETDFFILRKNNQLENLLLEMIQMMLREKFASIAQKINSVLPSRRISKMEHSQNLPKCMHTQGCWLEIAKISVWNQ